MNENLNVLNVLNEKKTRNVLSNKMRENVIKAMNTGLSGKEVADILLATNGKAGNGNVQVKVTREGINGVREKVLKYHSENGDAFHENDVNRIKTKDWYIERLLSFYKNNEEKTVNALIDSMKYFRSERFHEIDDTYFPSELWATGNLHIAGKGLTNEVNVLNALFKCWNLPRTAQGAEYGAIYRKFLVYQMFKLSIESETGKNIMNAYMDRAVPLNLDLGFFSNVGKDAGPYISQFRFKMIVVEVNLLVDPLIRLVIGYLNFGDVHFIKKSEMSRYMRVNTIPRWAGGTKVHSRIPEGVRSGKCLSHLAGIPATVWESVRQQNMLCIKEGMAESGGANIDDYLRSC